MEAMIGVEDEKCKTVMDSKVELNCTKWWKIVPRTEKPKILHTEFMLRKNRNENEVVQRRKARLFACDNEEQESKENTFSAVLDSVIVRPAMCLAK